MIVDTADTKELVEAIEGLEQRDRMDRVTDNVDPQGGSLCTRYLRLLNRTLRYALVTDLRSDMLLARASIRSKMRGVPRTGTSALRI